MKRKLWKTLTSAQTPRGLLSCAAVAWLALTAPAAAQTCEVAPVDCLRPVALAQIDGARFALGSTGGADADAWVARFDGGAEEPTWRTTFSGSGADSVATFTLNRGGAELLVAGSTTSPDLQGLTGKNAGGRDGFVARLDAATGRILSGALVGGAGDEELSGVVSDEEGNIVVAGIGQVPGFGEPPAELTVTEAADAAGEGTPVFVATLDPSLKGETALFDLGTIQVKQPRAWIDCKGRLVVGVVAQKGTSNCNGGPWPNLVYEQSHINDDYLSDHNTANPTVGTPPGGWGYQALRWKEYRANGLIAPPGPFYIANWWLAGGPIPKSFASGHPGCSDVPTLNQRETEVFLKGGSPQDPSGGWMCGQHNNVAELAVFSAFLFKKWGTPVFTPFFKPTLLPNNTMAYPPYAAGLSRVTFRPDCIDPNAYNGQTLDALCQMGTYDNINQLPSHCTISAGIPGVAGPGYNFVFEKFDGSSWGPNPSWYTSSRLWDLNIFSPFDFWYKPGEWVADPPEGSEEEVAFLAEAARLSADLVMRPGLVRVTQLGKDGQACAQTIDAVFSAKE